MTIGRELVAALVLVVQLGAVGVTTAVVVPRLVGPDRLERALAAVLLVLVQATGVPLALGMVGLLRMPVVVLAHLAIAAVAVARLGAPDLTKVVLRLPRWSLLERAAVAATTVYLALGGALSLRPQRSFEFDTKEYHLANLASWLQRGHIWGLPYAQPGSMTANHPGSGEMFGLWLALPSHGDELVYLTPVAFGLLAVLAGAVLGRELATHDHGAALGALGALAVLTAPVYFGQVDSLLTDLVASAALLAAVAFLAVARRHPTPPAGVVALAGMALGLGVGSKYTALLPGLALAVVAYPLLRRSRAWLWLVPGVLALAAPWYLRNIVTTGNPLFPQALGPLDGGTSPYDVLETSLLDHTLDGETGILRHTFTLARQLVGPVLVVAALGLLAPLVQAARHRDRNLSLWVGALIAVSLALYAATPYSGGGPTGLSFIIASCFRYALVAVLLAAVAGAVLAGPWLGGLAVAVALAWNINDITESAAASRPELEVTSRTLLAAIAVALLVVVGHWLLEARPDLWRKVPATGLAAAVTLGALAGGLAAFHRLDRGRTPTTLEATLLVLGADRPAVVLGVADLRAVLGPRLERPLIRVSRGGAADEVPFADDAQLRRRVLGEETPPPPPHLARELDLAIEQAHAELLVVGDISPVGYPDGWVPSSDWCLAGGDAEGTVYAHRSIVPPGVACLPAPGR